MTQQEILNYVVEFIIKQGRPSVDIDSQMCKYRHPEGLKCAVGCLIKDEDYNPKMESLNLTGIIDSSIPVSKFIFDNRDILRALQDAHDSNSILPLKQWKESFIRNAKQVAARFELEWNPEWKFNE